MDWIIQWWRQPDHYEWLSEYLAVRNLQSFTRNMMAGIVLLLGVAPVLMLFSDAGPHSAALRGLSVAVTAACTVMALLWLVKWPTRRQSAAFVVTANVGVSASCLAQAWPVSGIQGCTAFAALAGYVAFYHNARYLVFTLAIAVGTALICAVAIVAAGDVALAANKLLILVISILAVPFSLQFLVHTLGLDAFKSHTDPLTELPNRRGFRRSVRVLANASSRNGMAGLSVVMVDLDAFKRINDTAGHAAGDRTLVAVGDILRRSRPRDAVVARIGGEEFVAAMFGDHREAIRLAERIRREITQIPSHLTASIGVASASLCGKGALEIPAEVERLVELADRAMYKAKRQGGNRVLAAEGPDEACAEKPIPSSATVTDGREHRTDAHRALSGVDPAGTTVAVSVDADTAEQKRCAHPAAAEVVNPTPTTTAIANEQSGPC